MVSDPTRHQERFFGGFGDTSFFLLRDPQGVPMIALGVPEGGFFVRPVPEEAVQAMRATDGPEETRIACAYLARDPCWRPVFRVFPKADGLGWTWQRIAYHDVPAHWLPEAHSQTTQTP